VSRIVTVGEEAVVPHPMYADKRSNGWVFAQGRASSEFGARPCPTDQPSGVAE
jgi:hypothetical protein